MIADSKPVNRRTVGSALAVVAALAGCSSGTAGPPANTSAASDGGGASDAGGKDTAGPVANDSLDYSTNDELGIAFSDKERTDPYGSYTQLTVTDRSPLVTYDESLVSESTFYAFSPEEVLSAQIFAARFAIEQTDSTLLWDSSDEAVDAWLDENIDMIDERYHEEVEEDFRNPDGNNSYNLINGDAGQWRSSGFDPIYVPGQPRLQFTEAKLTEVRAFIAEEDGAENIFFNFELVSREDVYDREEDASGVLVFRNTQGYALGRDGNGGWVIVGWIEESNREAIAAEDFDPDKEYALKDASEKPEEAEDGERGSGDD